MKFMAFGFFIVFFMEKYVFINWLAVVPGGCWLSRGETGCKEGAAPKLDLITLVASRLPPEGTSHNETLDSAFTELRLG